MPRQYQPVNVTSFSKGFLTEFTYLNFPDSASVDEQNFVLNRDGSRQRRYGMDQEADTDTRYFAYGTDSTIGNLYEWDYPDNDYEAKLLVIQDGADLIFYDRTAETIGDGYLDTVTDIVPLGQDADFASVDGKLVVVAGEGDIAYVTYDRDAKTFSSSTYRLKVRDTFGLRDEDHQDENVDLRVSTSDLPTPTATMVYNWRNQTWAQLRMNPNDNLFDCVYYFAVRNGIWPSNADTVTQSLYANANDSDDRITKRFWDKDLYKNPIGSTEAPKGYFIIDLLLRGESRKEQWEALHEKYGDYESSGDPYTLRYPYYNSLPLADYHTKGPTCVCEYAGRAWYSGFNGQLKDGDDNSPRLGSYVVFSQLVQYASQLNKCYSAGDPTSSDDYELVDTDGGFVTLDEASNIQYLTNLGDKLIVLAANGVWSIEGGSDYGFTASSYKVTKISDKGAISRRSIVSTSDTIYYFSESGIFTIAPNEYGDLTANNITLQTIQSFYDDIDYTYKEEAFGIFDSYERTIRWVYGGNHELILNVDLAAFSYNYIYTSGTYTEDNEVLGEVEVSTDLGYKVLAAFTVPPYTTSTSQVDVTVDGDTVTVDGEDVYVNETATSSSFKEIKYLVYVPEDSDNETGEGFFFSNYSNTTFKDWGDYDAEAYMVTGYVNGGDLQRKKQVNYLTLHFNQTETGFDSDFELEGQSSCRVSTAWDWVTSTNSNRWSRSWQGYRLPRLWMPPDSTSDYDNGWAVISTKNKLRGKGKVLSLKFNTEEEKDCQLLGWSYFLGVQGNV